MDVSSGALFNSVKEQGSRSRYSIFPIKDELSWKFYQSQFDSRWPANEIDYDSDKAMFDTLSSRLRRLIGEMLGFLSPGDVNITSCVNIFAANAKTPEEVYALNQQNAVEAVHSIVYGSFVMTYFPDETERNSVLSYVDDLPCIKAKMDLTDKYTKDPSVPECLREFAQACSEGILFVEIFAPLFALKTKGILPAFIFANELIAKEESDHRGYYCERAKRAGISKYASEAKEIASQYVNVSKDSLRFMLREPIFSKEEDDQMGMTLPAFEEYTELLGDQTLRLSGVEALYNARPTLPWMSDLSLTRKANQFEVAETNYKGASLMSFVPKPKKSVVKSNINPNNVDF